MIKFSNPPHRRSVGTAGATPMSTTGFLFPKAYRYTSEVRHAWPWVEISHPIEGCELIIYIDHRPLSFAFSKKHDSVSQRRARHRSFVPEFTCDIHVSGEDDPFPSRKRMMNIKVSYTLLKWLVAQPSCLASRSTSGRGSSVPSASFSLFSCFFDVLRLFTLRCHIVQIILKSVDQVF